MIFPHKPDFLKWKLVCSVGWIKGQRNTTKVNFCDFAAFIKPTYLQISTIELLAYSGGEITTAGWRK